jgi:hypothetical protein
MSQQSNNCAIAVIGIDIGKNSFHVVGHDARKSHLEQIWSALPQIADIDLSNEDFSVGPKPDVSECPTFILGAIEKNQDDHV